MALPIVHAGVSQNEPDVPKMHNFNGCTLYAVA